MSVVLCAAECDLKYTFKSWLWSQKQRATFNVHLWQKKCIFDWQYLTFLATESFGNNTSVDAYENVTENSLYINKGLVL